MKTTSFPGANTLTTSESDHSATRAGVGIGVLLLTVLDLAYVAMYGRSVPIWDDFMVVAPMVGDTPLVPWLWAQHNFHRIPLPKLIYFLSIKLTNWDFRSSMFLSVGVLGFLSFLLAEGARRLRGDAARWTDLFFPLVLLHGGHAANMLLSSQIDLVFPVATICGALLIVLHAREPLPARLTWSLAGVLMLVFLSGGFGLSFLLTFGCWLIYASLFAGATSRLMRILLGAIVLGTIGLYFVGYHPPGNQPPFPGVGQSLLVALEALTTCFGTAAKPSWTKTGGGIGLITLGILIGATAVALRAWIKHPAERLRAAGILAFLAGLVGLMLGIGWSRGRLGPMYGFQPRYVTLATPLLICTYFVAELYLSPTLRWWSRIALLLLACGLFAVHIVPTIHYGHGQSAMQDAFIRDVRAGVPREVILDRYVPGIEENRIDLNDHLERLHAHQVDGY